MVSICTVELDEKGRFSLPKKFLESNGWYPTENKRVKVVVKPIQGQNSDVGVNLIFDTTPKQIGEPYQIMEEGVTI